MWTLLTSSLFSSYHGSKGVFHYPDLIVGGVTR